MILKLHPSFRLVYNIIIIYICITIIIIIRMFVDEFWPFNDVSIFSIKAIVGTDLHVEVILP